MSELWICREKTAESPFFIEEAGISIGSIEELCYYLYHNIYFLDDKMMDSPLFAWMQQELAMPRLAAALYDGRKKGKNTLWCAWMILKEAGCYPEKELEELDRLCQEMSNKSDFECSKMKADHLLNNGRYISSIREYNRLLQIENAKGSYPILIGNIRHNLGCAHARLFLFEEAAEHFQAAYRLNQSPASRQAYEDALKCKEELCGSEGNFPALQWDQAKTEAYLRRLRDDYKKKVMEYGTF